ncbi:MAG TPA: hypothetical protein VHJ69_09895 [Gemmatimonadales bacterium]|jgi:hypothetical protein|nr:hypothetical protein [Gemmatimonadales bacterium]
MTAHAPEPPPAAQPAVRRASWLVVLAGIVLIAALGAAAFFAVRPTFAFTNRLAAPVRIVVNGAAGTVAPGETVKARVSRDRVVAEWELVRPLSADGRPMGEEVRGAWVINQPRGTVERRAEPRVETGDYFAPLVSNETPDLLRITVNAGLDGARDCGCAVRPGARRVFIGYYRVYRNSTVQATDRAGRTATFRDLGEEAQRRGWTVGLRFTPDGFSAPAG